MIPALLFPTPIGPRLKRKDAQKAFLITASCHFFVPNDVGMLCNFWGEGCLFFGSQLYFFTPKFSTLTHFLVSEEMHPLFILVFLGSVCEKSLCTKLYCRSLFCSEIMTERNLCCDTSTISQSHTRYELLKVQPCFTIFGTQKLCWTKASRPFTVCLRYTVRVR